MASRLQRLNIALQAARRFYSAKAGAEHGHESAKIWKQAFYFLGVPTVALVYYNAFYLTPQHPVRDEFIPYEHLRIRTKPYPWGDGNHSLFHNPYYNALPEGYDEGTEELHPGAHH